jgi:hypothetical protein
VDYVAGNPPWVNWESLPNDYRQSTARLWQDYDLFRHKGYKAKLGGGKDDVSTLMTYVAHDKFLSEGGRLGFVITQSVFKTVGGGEGFRSFEYEAEGHKWYLPPIAVHDLSDFQPFEGATNRTAIVILEKKRSSFSYPVPYTVWHKAIPGRISPEMDLREVRAATVRTTLAAQPVQRQVRTSPWLTAPQHALSGIQRVIGQSDYKAYAGCCTWLNSVYWIRILDKRFNGELLIENLNDVGKIKVARVQAVIEPDLVYPLLRGRDVQRWHAESSAHIILANRTDKLAGIPESEMKRQYPKTFAYFKQFEGDHKKPLRGTLRARSGYRQYFKPTDPFYSIYNVGPYTMSPWKVLWPEVGHSVRAGVCGPSEVEKVKPSLPDHTIVAVPCESGSEAHFIAALLNSSPARVAAAAYIVLHPSPHIMQNIAVPRFGKDKANHARLAELSRECHAAVAKGDAGALTALEDEVDITAARIWGITDDELGFIQDALAEMSPGVVSLEKDDEADDE